MNLRCYLSILLCILAKVGTLVYSKVFDDLLFIVHRFANDVRIQLVQVWHITLKPDDQNLRGRLSATFLSSFHREDCGELRSLSLLGTLIAFGIRTRPSRNWCSYVAIVDWAKAVIHNTSHRRPAASLSYLRKVIYDDLPGVS